MDEKDYRKRIKRFMRWAAPLYDPVAGRVIREYARRAVRLVPSLSGFKALDLCTGTGIVASLLVEEGAEVTAIDFTPAMLQRARRRLKDTGTEVLLMEANRLEFDDNAFDLVTVSMALHEMPPGYRDEVLAEAHRVCRRFFLVIDHCGVPPNPVWRFVLALVERIEGGEYQEFIRHHPVDLIEKSGFCLLSSEYTGNFCLLLFEKEPREGSGESVQLHH